MILVAEGSMNDDDQPTIFKESIEPGVINREMLVNLVTQQGPKGEAGRLFLKDGIKLDEVTEIRIEFLSKCTGSKSASEFVVTFISYFQIFSI